MKHIPQFGIPQLHKLFGYVDVHKEYFYVNTSEADIFDPEPFRTETYGLAFVKKGNVRLCTGLDETVLEAPAIFALGPSIIRSFERETVDPFIEIVFFTEAFFLNNQADVFYLTRFPFFEEANTHSFALNQASAKRFESLYMELHEVLKYRHIHEARLAKSYINILLLELDALYKESTLGNKTTEIGLPLLEQFKTLLSKKYKEERGVAFYADQLHITGKHLSEFLKANTGQSASQWINRQIILEAKVLLQHKDLSIGQVGDYLNFSDQSVFGKFFKTNTGTTPMEYRVGIK